MSHEQSETTNVLLNNKNFSAKSKEIKTIISSYQEYCFDISIALYEEIKNNNSVKDLLKKMKQYNTDSDFVNNKIHSFFSIENGLTFHTQKSEIKNKYQGRFDLTETLFFICLNEIFRSDNPYKILKPRKSTFINFKKSEKDISFEIDNAFCISIITSKNLLSFDIYSCNHAVDNFYHNKHFVYNMFLKLFDNYEWGKKEGMRQISDSEYHGESCTYQGNYLNLSFS